MTHQATKIEEREPIPMNSFYKRIMEREPIPMNSFYKRIMEGEGHYTNPGNYSDLLHEAAKLETALHNMILAVRVLQRDNDALLKENDELRQKIRSYCG